MAQFTIIDYNDVTISATPPSSPVTNMLWLDTSVTPNQLKRYTGSAWVIVNDVSSLESEIDSKVTKDEVINEINIRPDGITINASKIGLLGPTNIPDLTADKIKGGKLALGGGDYGNGYQVIYDANNNPIIRMSKEGTIMKNSIIKFVDDSYLAPIDGINFSYNTTGNTKSRYGEIGSYKFRLAYSETVTGGTINESMEITDSYIRAHYNHYTAYGDNAWDMEIVPEPTWVNGTAMATRFNTNGGTLHVTGDINSDGSVRGNNGVSVGHMMYLNFEAPEPDGSPRPIQPWNISHDTGVLKWSQGWTDRMTLDEDANLSVDGYVTSKGSNGYPTSNTGSANAGKWTKIATLDVTSQYSDSQFLAYIDSDENVNAINSSAFLNCRVKQQSAMGSVPIVQVGGHLYSYLDPGDVKAVLVSNTTSLTRIELYVKLARTYDTFNLVPIFSKGNITYHSVQPFLAALPTGTQYSFAAHDLHAGELNIEVSGQDKTLLKFNTERTWQFIQKSTGATTGLALKTDVDAKNFTIESPTGAKSIRFYLADANCTGYINESRIVTDDRFDNSKAESGYTKLPNGLIIQWGIATISSTITPTLLNGSYYKAAYNIAFPTPFPNALFSIQGSSDYAVTWGTANPGATPTQNFTAACGAVQSASLNRTIYLKWIAIGY